MRQASLFGADADDEEEDTAWPNRFPAWDAGEDGALAIVLDVAWTGNAYGLAESLNLPRRGGRSAGRLLPDDPAEDYHLPLPPQEPARWASR